MQANFESPVLAFTLAYEGGKADDPRDPGGRTNQGVTQRSYAAYRAKAGQAAADVFAMTAAERDALYRTGYWDAVGGAALPAGVDLACFDFAVNSGPARALAALGQAGGAGAASRDPAACVKAISAARLSFLHALGTFKTFGRGWTARVAACEALGVKMALHQRVGTPVDAAPTRGTALVLGMAAKSAQARALSHKRVAGGAAATAVVAGGAPPMLGAGPTLGWLLAALCCAGALATAALVWRAHQQAVRARAYAALAKSA